MKKGRHYLGRRLPNFMDSGADDDIFLSLEEEAPVAKQPRVPKKAPRARKESPRKTNKPEPEQYWMQRFSTPRWFNKPRAPMS